MASPFVSNIFIEHFEKFALDSEQHKLSLWIRYLDDMFVIWPHGPECLQNFLSHLNSLSPSIQFTIETESDSAIGYLDLVIREETTLATKVYRKSTLAGRYLNFNSNHPPHVKRGLIRSLHDRASTIRQERQDLVKETSSLRSDLQLSSYTKGFIDSVIYSKGNSRLNKKQKPMGSVYIPYVNGVSKKFKIRTIFKIKHTLRSSLMKTRPKRVPQQTAQYIYSISCE
jgi:hypothetical protein